MKYYPKWRNRRQTEKGMLFYKIRAEVVFLYDSGFQIGVLLHTPCFHIPDPRDTG